MSLLEKGALKRESEAAEREAGEGLWEGPGGVCTGPSPWPRGRTAHRREWLGGTGRVGAGVVTLAKGAGCPNQPWVGTSTWKSVQELKRALCRLPSEQETRPAVHTGTMPLLGGAEQEDPCDSGHRQCNAGGGGTES